MGTKKPRQSDDGKSPADTGWLAPLLNYLPKLTKRQAFVLLVVAGILAAAYYVVDRFAPTNHGGTTNTTSGASSPIVGGQGNTTTINSGSGQLINYGNLSVVSRADEEEQDDDGPPPPVPESFPDLESSGLRPLTDANRRSPNYVLSDIVVDNRTEFNLILAYSFEPNLKEPGRASRYAHRQSGIVRPGEQKASSEPKFGGPVHLSVYSKNPSIDSKRRWYSTDQWFDMGIVKSRTVVIEKSISGFDVKVIRD